MGCTVATVLVVICSLGQAAAGSNLHGRLAIMRITKESGVLSSFDSRGLFDDSFVSVSIRFADPPDERALVALENLGARFHRLGRERAHVGNTYTAHVPWDALDAVASRDGIQWIEPDWHPVPARPLNISVPEIQADRCWRSVDSAGQSVTGKGVKICDLDTGIDPFHPMFWSPGDTLFAWIDSDVNGLFDPGADAVDLDGDGAADESELVRYIEAPVYDPYYVGGVTNPAGYTLDMDWLYNDENLNGQRDYGPPLFDDSSPSFGERLFIPEDRNGDGVLGVGERLTPLDRSKVEATYETGSVERVYGIDLIQSEGDAWGHGTGVCGIACGGQIGRRLVGVAPDATLLVANFFSDIPYTAAQAWGADRGADVMIYEIGWWISDYMDGSSTVEVNIDSLTAQGITQVNPNGNLGGADKHFYKLVWWPNVDSVRCTMQSGYGGNLYLSLLWPGSGTDPDISVKEPGGAVVACSTNGTYALGPYTLSFVKSTSPRNTVLADMWIYHQAQVSGQFKLYLAQNAPGSTPVDGYIADDRSGWSGGTWFLDFATDDGTVDWPANADSAIGVASYSTRGPFGLPPGEISGFSGRGARIDGYQVTNLAAPGNYDVFSSRSMDQYGASFGQYTWFGGTSAAAPHVAGAAALVLQAIPGSGGNRVKHLLEQHACTDTYTGSVPNHTWGAGKLRVWPAIESAVTGTQDEPIAPSASPLCRVHPNPCAPVARITYFVPSPCRGSLEILDVVGRRMSLLREGMLAEGFHEISYHTAKLPPGVYTIRLRAGARSSTARAVLVR